MTSASTIKRKLPCSEITCDRSFVPVTSRQRFCSIGCGDKDRHRRQRERYQRLVERYENSQKKDQKKGHLAMKTSKSKSKSKKKSVSAAKVTVKVKSKTRTGAVKAKPSGRIKGMKASNKVHPRSKKHDRDQRDQTSINGQELDQAQSALPIETIPDVTDVLDMDGSEESESQL